MTKFNGKVNFCVLPAFFIMWQLLLSVLALWLMTQYKNLFLEVYEVLANTQKKSGATNYQNQNSSVTPSWQDKA